MLLSSPVGRMPYQRERECFWKLKDKHTSAVTRVVHGFALFVKEAKKGS